MMRLAVLPYGRTAIIGAIMLGLGRAIGETMAVTMVIGNRPDISLSFFAPGSTMASVIANEFTEATYDLYVQALVEIGLVLAGRHGARQCAWLACWCGASPALRPTCGECEHVPYQRRRVVNVVAQGTMVACTVARPDSAGADLRLPAREGFQLA